MNTTTIKMFKRDWLWPAEDTECRKVAFSWAADLELVYPYCKNFGVAVQAGGNMGVWPWLMAKEFFHVHTFEPDPDCYDLLLENMQTCTDLDVNDITMNNTGLWSKAGRCRTVYPNPKNYGSMYLDPDHGKIKMITLDSYGLEECDLIYLDVEGSEYKALQGATSTISKFKPVIAFEDKGLSEKYGTQKGAIEKWLSSEFGYRVVARPHRDVIMVP